MDRTSAIKKRLLSSSGAAVLVMLPGGALAQEANAEAHKAAVATQEGDIIVTAQRRSERLENVPMAITAISPVAAENRGIRSLQDLSQGVAGVQINFAGFATQPTIRGVSALANNVGLENNVAVYVDGFYQDNTSIINADFANLESIQVLKGPQGTLYGRNATGGAFLINTKAPSARFEGKIDLKYASFDDRSASGYVSGPIAEGIGLSVAGYARKSDGYYDLLDASGQEIGNAAPTHSYAARTKLRFATDDVTATVAYNYTELSDPRGVLFTLETLRSSAVPPKVGRLYEPRTFASNRGTSTQRDAFHQPTLTIAWDSPIGTLTSYSGYSHGVTRQKFDVDGSYADLNFQNLRYVTTNFQENLDYNITAIKNLDLNVGFNYWDNEVRNNFGENYAGNRLLTLSRGKRLTRSWAGYIDGAYHITDKLTLALGGRYTQETVKIGTSTLVPATGNFAAPPLSPEDNKLRFSNFSPRGSIRFEISPRTNVYASITRGFRSGAPQAITTVGQYLFVPVLPEKITAYEVGFKTAQRNIRFDAAAFYYDYTDLQVGSARLNPLVPNTTFTFTMNAPKATIYGAEAQASWTPVERLNVDLSGAWLHARYTDFPAATGTGFNATTGLNAPGQLQNWNGQQMARAPDLSAALGLSYEFINVFGGALLAQTNVKYTDSYVPNNPSLFGPLDPTRATQQRFREGSYTLVNASLTWTDPSDHFKAGVFVNNLFNVDYHLSVNGLAFGNYGTWAPPRVFGVRLGYGF